MPEETTTDPLGRAIRLHDRTRYGHILKGHPEVAGRRAEACSAIAEPREIRQSRSDAAVRVYYRRLPDRGVMIAIVADVELGLVKTAYPGSARGPGRGRMVITDAIEGTVDGAVWFHYDVSAGVLYVRRAAYRDRPAVGEETDDGDILLRDYETNRPVGVTFINWWRRFGKGPLPDSLQAIQQHIEPVAARIPSAA